MALTINNVVSSDITIRSFTLQADVTGTYTNIFWYTPNGNLWSNDSDDTQTFTNLNHTTTYSMSVEARRWSGGGWAEISPRYYFNVKTSDLIPQITSLQITEVDSSSFTLTANTVNNWTYIRWYRKVAGAYAYIGRTIYPLNTYNLTSLTPSVEVEMKAIIYEDSGIPLCTGNTMLKSVIPGVSVVETIPGGGGGMSSTDWKWKIEFLTFKDDYQAEAGTDGNTLYLTAHGLLKDDMIVNTTRRTNYTAERGCRMVSSTIATDSFNITGASITDQAEGDAIKTFSFQDRTSYIKGGSISIRRKIAGQTDANFTVIIDNPKSSFVPLLGQHVRISFVDSLGTTYVILKGFIDNMDVNRQDLGSEEIFFDIHLSNLTQIANRRTVKVDYDISTSLGTIFDEMVTKYLIQEGIHNGTGFPGTGSLLGDDWKDDCISITDVCDRCSSESAFQWYVDDEGYTVFTRETPIVDAEHTLEDGGTFTDYTNVKVSQTVDSYANKIFFTGGTDGLGNPVIIATQNNDAMNHLQYDIAGTGVFGSIIRDSSINDSEYHIAETNTSTTEIYITNHGLEIGHIVWNLTRGAYSQVTNINTHHFTIYPSIASQVATDSIVLFPVASDIVRNALKKGSTTQKKITFDSGTCDWTPGKKLFVNIDSILEDSQYYLITGVDIYDPQLYSKQMRCHVEAILRDNADFSTQKGTVYLDFFKEMR
jgi:hypothetical protein